MIYGQLEIEVLNSIWGIQEVNEDADISIGDIVEVLTNNGTERAYTTVKTVMDRLVSKDVLVRYKKDRKFFYRSAIERSEASKQAVDNIASQFFGGNYVSMIRFIERECENLLA